MTAQSQPTRVHPDGYPSESTAYMGLQPDDDPSEGLLKDRGSPTLDARSQRIMGYTLMAPEQVIRLYEFSP